MKEGRNYSWAGEILAEAIDRNTGKYVCRYYVGYLHSIVDTKLPLTGIAV